MNIRAWSISLLLFLSTVTAVGQTANRYLKAPLPNGWEWGSVSTDTSGRRPLVEIFRGQQTGFSDCFGGRP